MLANVAAILAEGTPSVTYWVVSGDQISPLFNAIRDNINAAIPYGLGIMGSFVGINVLKRIIYTFL